MGIQPLMAAGVSPTMACSWEAPDPIRSPTTTSNSWPVTMKRWRKRIALPHGTLLSLLQRSL
jgi:hypothetical protein